jgi:hypothetical protein
MQSNAERGMPFCQGDGFPGRGGGHQQAGAGENPLGVALDDGGVDRRIEPEIIGIGDQPFHEHLIG